MGRKIREITIVIIILLAVSAAGTVQESKSLAKDTVSKAEERFQRKGIR